MTKDCQRIQVELASSREDERCHLLNLLSPLTLMQIGGEKPEKLLLFCDRIRLYVDAFNLKIGSTKILNILVIPKASTCELNE